MASLLRFTFDIGFIAAAIISCLVVIVYTAFAGLSGVILTDLLQFIMIIIMIILIRMDIWQRILAARNEKTAKRASIISGLGMLPFYIIFPLVGMSLKIVLDESIEPKYVTYLFLERHSSENTFNLKFGLRLFCLVFLLSAWRCYFPKLLI